MAEFFNASDVVGAAVEMERRGQAAYRQTAKATTDPKVKRLFENLAVEEARHEEMFKAMAERIGPAELPAWSSMEEYSAYLGALLDSHALFSPGFTESLAAASVNLDDAVRQAMRLEKDSMLFFQEMLYLVPGSEHPLIQECIEEERRHLRQLAAMLQT
ncbi:ferritin-like domain-containing protein [Fundidesulfovibrio putealis]|uniref:ferritin-like domain-containing protein n=1 Tax=Fundidesulfovibrio putealis TaxID=270496 RepID=UPI0004058F8F|nr:ferritin family protein [Fundidesulfovibrio putealis]